jgi:hypothetical protein
MWKIASSSATGALSSTGASTGSEAAAPGGCAGAASVALACEHQRELRGRIAMHGI